MGKCQGDCDADSDCGKGLKCFQRDGFTPVPGCKGKGINSWDYCYKPGSSWLSEEVAKETVAEEAAPGHSEALDLTVPVGVNEGNYALNFQALQDDARDGDPHLWSLD